MTKKRATAKPIVMVSPGTYQKVTGGDFIVIADSPCLLKTVEQDYCVVYSLTVPEIKVKESDIERCKKEKEDEK